MTADVPVLIVGAGPSGLTLACELARRGVACRVVDKAAARMVDRFRTGNALLAGDAAHVHSSAGGQGLNTSIQDAYNLGWKLAAVVQGAPPELLDTYEEERLPVAAHVLGLTSQLHRVNFRPLSGPPPALHQLDLTYRGGALACDDRASPGALRAGDRAPEARMDDGRSLCDVRRGTHWTLLAFARAEVDLGRVPVSVRVEHPHALEGYDVADGDLVLIRPDGYIGVISSSLDTVRSYLQRFAGAHP